MTDHTPTSVLGTGALGTALATALLAADHPTTVWNRTPERADDLVRLGAIRTTSAAEAVAAARVVVLALADETAVRAVLEPVADRLTGRVVVNLTSGTPEQARGLAAMVSRSGAGHLDGAAMSGLRLVGQPSALFLYSGSGESFSAAEPVLGSLGRATHVGTDPGAASLYDTALLTVNMGALNGFYHALALVRASGGGAVDFATVAAGYLPFLQGLLVEHARDVSVGRYPPHEGTLEVLAAAMGHVSAASRQVGIGAGVPEGVLQLIEDGIAAGHGQDGPASLVDVIGARREMSR